MEMETSSEENVNDLQDQVKEDTGSSNNTNKRSYECTFCKRGFTNAQALGGHMNIHRKDRAGRGKQVTGSSSVSSKGVNEEYSNNPNYNMGPVSSHEPTKYDPVVEAHRTNYRRPGSNPRYPYGYYYHGSDHFVATKSPSLGLNVEQAWGDNLSLQIGSNLVEDNKVINRGVSKEDEVDLELRLGHDP